MTDRPTLSATPLLDALLTAVAEACEVDRATLGPDTELESLGVDSLVASQIIAEVEFALDTELPIDLLEEFEEIKTIGDVADAFLAASAASHG